MAKYTLLALRHLQTESEPITEINIIPVIDISLVLLVILFVTAPLLSYPSYPVDLPRSRAKESREKTVAVTYTKKDRMAVASVDVEWADLEGAVASELERKPGAVVVLRVDREVPYRVVQRLILAAKRAGAKNVALATEKYK
jgi:biopolymer transport protein ExbD